MSRGGVIFYQGPSLIDGKPIVGIATFGTSNEKTGNLVQTWILRSDIHPQDAVDTGEDKSICGSCPLRGLIRPASELTNKKRTARNKTVNKGRACYVTLNQAPTAIYGAFKRDRYPLLDAKNGFKLGRRRGLRYGSYGDPVAIPMEAWDTLATYCTGKSEPGYTHQWRNKKFAAWSKKVMASTHSIADNELAASKGWRTFRTSIDATDIASNEIHCPASLEGGYKATCETCGACNGRNGMSDVRKSIVIMGHGGGGKMTFLEAVVEKAA